MQRGENFEEFEALNGVSIDDVLSMFEAILEAFPMILLVNLTKNTYIMLKEDGFFADELPKQGVYDELIEYASDKVHANYQTMLLESFSREHLLAMFRQGKNSSYAKLYQKGRGNSYQWVEVHAFRVKDKDGDVREICINKILGSGQGYEHERLSGSPQ